MSQASQETPEPLVVRPSRMHKRTGEVLAELTYDRQPRVIINAYGRTVAVLLHPSDPRLAG